MFGADRVVCCFFQAEDGIRDLVRSRGLGDVYKRQGAGTISDGSGLNSYANNSDCSWLIAPPGANAITPVSYTHLTLPTSDLV